MSTQRYVATSFWDDAWIQELSPSAKLLFMYLLTNPLTNIAGVYKITYRRIAFDTGLPQAEISSIIEEFQAAGKAAFVEEYIILPNWPKYQRTTSKDTKAGIDRVLAELPETVLVSLKEINYQYDAVPIPYPKATIRPPIGPLPLARPTNTLNSYSSPILKPSGMQANSSSRDNDEIPDVADASMPPAACPFISTQEVKNACALSPFAIRLSVQDLEDIATRLSEECLDARFVAYVIRRAQEPGVKNPGAFARQALLGAGSFSQMPDEYRAERESQTPKAAEAEREPPPAICDECGAEVRHLPTAGESFCTNAACGTSWTWDAAFGWLKSEERAVPISDSGAPWRKAVEGMEKT